jgi:hypothetical protein
MKYAGARVIAKNMDKIQDKYQIEVSDKIIEKDAETMAEYIDKLQEKYQIEVAKKLINNIKN